MGSPKGIYQGDYIVRVVEGKLILEPTEIWPLPTFTWMKLLLPSWKEPLHNCHMQSLFHWATTTLDNIYKLSLKCCFSLASALASSSGLIWLLSLTPLKNLHLPTLYILGPPRTLSLALLFLPFYLYLLPWTYKLIIPNYFQPLLLLLHYSDYTKLLAVSWMAFFS